MPASSIVETSDWHCRVLGLSESATYNAIHWLTVTSFSLRMSEVIARGRIQEFVKGGRSLLFPSSPPSP